MKTLLYFIELSELENFVEYKKYIKLLSPVKQAQIDRFKFDVDKKLSLLSDLFVRYLACKSLDLKNSDLIFERNVYGKPYLSGFPDFQYNISHTRNAVVIGLSGEPIGVDIEKIKSVDLKIAERFFCKSELRYILSRQEQQEKLFYEVWTKKEAYVKWVGKGLSLPLTSFDVTDIELSKILNVIEINDYMTSICNKAEFDRADLHKLNEYQAAKALLEFAH